MSHDDRFWRHFEGHSASNELDADHWIRVYTELQETLERIAGRGTGDTNRVEALMRVFEQRLRFWRGMQHDEPVLAARNGRRQRASGARGRSA